MFSHWSRPQLGLAPQAVQEVVHRKQNLATRGCVIASDCVDNCGCPYMYLCSHTHFDFWRHDLRWKYLVPLWPGFHFQMGCDLQLLKGQKSDLMSRSQLRNHCQLYRLGSEILVTSGSDALAHDLNHIWCIEDEVVVWWFKWLVVRWHCQMWIW